MDLKTLFFWREPIKEFFGLFGWFFVVLIIFAVPFLRVWWWILVPIILAPPLRELYLWWINWDFAYAKLKWVVLEITPPQENLVPMKAMEDILGMVWPIWDSPSWREIWCEGELKSLCFWCSWEIASLEGKIHFYLRALSAHRLMIESALYAHYPDIEIKEVDDYVKLVPPTAPNDDWDIFGEDYFLAEDDPLPIRTYEKFFEPQGEKISEEEKRLDPLISLLESMSKLGPNEYFWFHMIMCPVNKGDVPEFFDLAKSLIDKVSKRPVAKKTTLMDDASHMAKELIVGPEKESADSYKWQELAKSESGEKELLVTPGEREIISEIENKLKKPIFKTTLRAIYIAKRDNFKPSHKVLVRPYFAHFTAQNLNRIILNKYTRPKVHYVMRKRRVYLRTRKVLRMGILRLTPAFPDLSKYVSVYNTEELATIFHFPLRISGMVAPTMTKIESKKAGPPPNLPIE